MAFSLYKILKGLLIREENTLTPKEMELIPGGTAGTKTSVISSQTTDKTLTLPDATDTLVGKATTDTLTNKTFDADGTGNVLSNIDDGNIKAAAAIDASKLADGSVSNAEFQYLDGVTSSIQTQLNSKADDAALTAHISDTTTHGTTGDIVGTSDTQTLTNKTIDGGSNTLTNIGNTSLSTGIDANKIADGSVSNTEYQYINSLTSNAQTQLDGKASTALDNLASTAINANLLPGTDDTITLGDSTHRLASLWSKLLTNTGNLTIRAGSGGSSKIILDGETINIKSSSTDPVSGVAGDVYYNDAINKLKYYDGTAWKEIGSGSGGSKNYLTKYLNNPGNGDFEDGTTSGWSLANTATINDFPSGAPNIGASSVTNFSINSTSSDILAGTYSLQVVAAVSTVASQGFISDEFIIDNEDKAKVLKYSFTYRASSGVDQTNVWGVAIYDVDNNVWIQPTNARPIKNGFNQPGLAEGTFQTSSDGTTYQLFLYFLDNGDQASMIFDSFLIGPDPTLSNSNAIVLDVGGVASGAIGAAYNGVVYPTVNTDTNGAYLSGVWTCPETGYYDISASFSITGNPVPGDYSEIAIGKNGANFICAQLGRAAVSGGNGSFTNITSKNGVLLLAGDTLQVYSYSSFATPSYGALLSSSEFGFSVSKSVGSAGTGNVAYLPKVLVGLSANQTITTGGGPQKIAFDTIDSAYSTDASSFQTGTNRYTPKQPGNYLVNAAAFITASDNRWGIYLYKNGVAVANGGSGGISGDMASDVTFNVDMNGTTDYLEVFVENFSSVNTTVVDVLADTYFQVTRISDIINTNPNDLNVSAIYNRTAAISLITSTVAVINFDIKEKDTHNAYNGTSGIFTVPVSGEYEIIGAIDFAFNATGNRELIAVRNSNYAANGSKNLSRVNAHPTAPTTIGGAARIQCLAGDTLQLQVYQDSGVSLNLASTGESRFNFICIKRVGN